MHVFAHITFYVELQKSLPVGSQKVSQNNDHMDPKSVDPWSECLDPSSGGEVYLPPYPPPLDPLAGPPAKTSKPNPET